MLLNQMGMEFSTNGHQLVKELNTSHLPLAIEEANNYLNPAPCWKAGMEITMEKKWNQAPIVTICPVHIKTVTYSKKKGLLN